MEYHIAKKMFIAQLKRLKVKFLKDNYNMRGEHFEIKFTGDYSSFYSNYKKNNITIATTGYPSTKKYERDFDIENGNYKGLIEKINFIIEKDKQNLKEENKIEKLKKQEFLKVTKLVEKYNPKIDRGYKIEIDTPLIEIVIYPDDRKKIYLEYKEFDYKNLTKLIDKLKS